MTILEDSKKIGKSATWEKWEQISNYDMRSKEKQFLSAVVSELRHLKINHLLFEIQIRSSISELLRKDANVLKERLRKFIANKYDIMVRKLQFGDDIKQNFQSVETIVNYICDKMAEGADGNDFKILIPFTVKQNMKNALKVRDGKPY